MKEWYQISTQDVMKNMEATERGLTEDQVQARLQEYGENALAQGEKKTVLQVFLAQFLDLLVAILIVRAHWLSWP